MYVLLANGHVDWCLLLRLISYIRQFGRVDLGCNRCYYMYELT